MAARQFIATNDARRDFSDGSKPCCGQPDKPVFPAFHHTPDYLFGACADDHAVVFNALTKAHPGIFPRWANCGNCPDVFGHR